MTGRGTALRNGNDVALSASRSPGPATAVTVCYIAHVMWVNTSQQINYLTGNDKCAVKNYF
jgi:hypothetical protein